MEQENWQDKVILIAEDEKINFLFLKAVFKKTEAKIIWARNGEEVIDICEKEKKIDIVLMDIKMPGIDGYEATRKIKEKYPNITVIAQTAYNLSEDRDRAYEAGCDSFLAKPIKPKNLMATVKKFI
jgi:CheY-like chemotaxis protein